MNTLLQAKGHDDARTDSACSFQMVAHWLKTCLTEHSSCYFSRNKLPMLPTRVVDVGPADGSKDPHLFSSEGSRGLYITLSYCWGIRANLRTELRTMETFKKSIPFQDIPRTILEAIIITRRLGIRYLWVDALCITQDSKEEWLREAKNMTDVYRNSVLTIAASDAVDSDGGLFRARTRSRTRPVAFAPGISPFPRGSSVFAFGDRQESNDGIRRESHLDSRGWVLQEQLLSPRTLYYSSQELYWECAALLASESHPAGIPKGYDHNWQRRFFTELKRAIAGNDSTTDKQRVHMLWQKIVVNYSRRELTKESDKLVALAGAASQIASVLEDRFLAGLWVKWLWRDLLWWVERAVDSSASLGVRPTDFKAPSWSWASIKGPISYQFPNGTGHLRYYRCLQIISYSEKTDSPSNSVSGFITLRGILLPEVPYSFTKEKTSSTRQNVDPNDRKSPEYLGLMNPVWTPDVEGIEVGKVRFLVVAASHEWIICLGLMATGQGEGEFRRVGLAYWSSRFPPDCSEEIPRVITIV
jgi:hypothetical protein